VRGQSGSGTGVRATSETGTGLSAASAGDTAAAVLGQSFDTPADLNSPTPVLGSGTGVSGRSGSGTGVSGTSETGGGVRGQHTGMAAPGAPAVAGMNTGTGPGVLGRAVNGTSVAGVKSDEDDVGPGVRGIAPGDHPGVLAESGVLPPPPGSLDLDGGLALKVNGRSEFSTAGTGTIPTNTQDYEVENQAVRASSVVLVTLLGDPGPTDPLVKWVERDPGDGFTIHLTKKTTAATAFGFFVIN
jgi:hypothetical protein